MKRLRRMKRLKSLRRKRRQICSKILEPLPEISFDLVIEILTRLAAKPLMRFKSVSKLWSSMICSQYFTNRFLKVSSSSRLYMWLGLDNNKKVLLSSSSSPDPDGTTTISSFVVDQDLTIPAMEGYSISHVFRGLMCFINGPSAQIYNTTTRQLVVLPDIKESKIISEERKKKIMYHIGHDPLHNQYKVVCTISRPSSNKLAATFISETWVFILGEGQVSSGWRKIPSRCPPHCPLKQGLTINGCMHYLAWVRVPYPVLVTLDMLSEEISFLQEPEEAYWSPHYTDIIEYRGRVALLHHSDLEDEGVMELWVIEDEEKNRWSRKTLVLHPSQMNMVKMHIDDYMSLRVQGTTRNGEVILVPQNTSRTLTGEIIVKPQSTTLFYIFLYNLDKNHLRKVEINETSNRYLTNIWDVTGLDDIDNLMYL